MPIVARVIAILLVCGSVAAADDEVVDWRDAARCVGRVCSVRGTVAVTEPDGPTYRLYFDAEDRQVRVILMRGWLVTWPTYTGATIVATGKVRRFRDHIEQIVLAPENIAILDPGTASLPTATAPPPTATEPVPTATAPAPSAAATVPPPPSEAPDAPPTAAPAPPAPATPSEVEQLRQRVRQLEERVRELEAE